MRMRALRNPMIPKRLTAWLPYMPWQLGSGCVRFTKRPRRPMLLCHESKTEASDREAVVAAVRFRRNHTDAWRAIGNTRSAAWLPSNGRRRRSRPISSDAGCGIGPRNGRASTEAQRHSYGVIRRLQRGFDWRNGDDHRCTTKEPKEGMESRLNGLRWR